MKAYQGRKRPASFVANLPSKEISKDSGFRDTKTYYALKMLVVVICVTGCVYQLQEILILFFSFSSLVVIDTARANKLHIPGITLCNSNSVKLSKLKAKNATFASEWDAAPPDVDIIDNYLADMMANTEISSYVAMGPAKTDFLDFDLFNCSTDSSKEAQKKGPCKNRSEIVTTAQAIGNCFTLFHASTRKDGTEFLSGKAGYGQSPVLFGVDGQDVRAEISSQPFQPNEVFRIKVNFHREEYTALNDPVYGTITIHDPTVIPDTRPRHYLFYPGYYYEFFIVEQMNTLLPPPYDTECFDYEKNNKKYYQTKSTVVHPYLDKPLSQEDCVLGCLARSTLSNCGCWPPEIPFLLGFDKHQLIENTTWCNWDELVAEGHLFTASQQAFDMCFANNETYCRKKCHKDCKITRYNYVVQKTVWPGQRRIEASDPEKRRPYLEAQRKCCAVISVRYWTAVKALRTYKPKYAIDEFVAYIGGLLGLWLGVAFYNLWDIIGDLWIKAKSSWTNYKANRENRPLTAFQRRQMITPLRPAYSPVVRKVTVWQQFKSRGLAGTRKVHDYDADHDKYWYLPNLMEKYRNVKQVGLSDAHDWFVLHRTRK